MSAGIPFIPHKSDPRTLTQNPRSSQNGTEQKGRDAQDKLGRLVTLTANNSQRPCASSCTATTTTTTTTTVLGNPKNRVSPSIPVSSPATSPIPSCTSPDATTTRPSLQIVLTPHPSTHAQPNRRDLHEGVPIRLGRAVRALKSTPVATTDKTTIPPPTLTAAGVATTASTTPIDCPFDSKVVSRRHAELWTRDGQVYLRDTASSSGTFLNRLRLSPSGKESRPYPLRNGDVIQLGIDYVSDRGKDGTANGDLPIKDSYKAPILTITMIHPPPTSSHTRRPNLAHYFSTVLGTLLTLTNPYARSSTPLPSTPAAHAVPAPDCVICLCPVGPYQALFLAPCSHCYHFRCVRSLVARDAMFLCPLCRQVANLDASVSMESLCDLAGGDDGGVDVHEDGEEEDRRSARFAQMDELHEDDILPPDLASAADPPRASTALVSSGDTTVADLWSGTGKADASLAVQVKEGEEDWKSCPRWSTDSAAPCASSPTTTPARASMASVITRSLSMG
ncbi:hypothetical protein HKX48_006299 [Thoreauomyces humboldtii]|nr:hypothetical protein HKX48_006299 [Thoreauomyces humboldtii]